MTWVLPPVGAELVGVTIFNDDTSEEESLIEGANSGAKDREIALIRLITVWEQLERLQQEAVLRFMERLVKKRGRTF